MKSLDPRYVAQRREAGPPVGNEKFRSEAWPAQLRSKKKKCVESQKSFVVVMEDRERWGSWPAADRNYKPGGDAPWGLKTNMKQARPKFPV